MDLPCLIEALRESAAYPYEVGSVDVRQTHISAVFLAGQFVYKVKKPVRLAFLDFTTLESRRHFCAEEVRLNRRLAPEVYLGVVPIVATPTGVRVEGAGEPIEWAVKMQHLPDKATVQERLRRGDVDVDLVEVLAGRIASFHGIAETNERIAAFGRFEAVSRIILDIYEQAALHVGVTVSNVTYGRVKELAEQALARFCSLIDSRAARGMTRDCHGDLHLDHVYFLPDREPPGELVIIDCIEFNERFRFIDPVADMAFPTMDFGFYGRRDLGAAFVDAYFDASTDEEGRALLPMYTAYRATVRGTVEGLLLGEKEVPEAERAAALARAQAHWLLALTELEEPGRKPCLLLMAGLPGTGKSSLAKALSESAGFEVIRSDVVRKELAGLSGSEPAMPQLGGAYYTAAWNERTYAECLRRAEGLLFEGKRVLVDATFREDANRRTFLDAARRWAVPTGLFLCQAEPETIRRRLQNRQGDASDADWSIYVQAAANWEALGEVALRNLHIISTDGGTEKALADSLEKLRQLELQG